MKKNLLILLSGVLLAGMLSCTGEPAAEPESTDAETRVIPGGPGLTGGSGAYWEYPPEGGLKSFTVNAEDGLRWSVINKPSWITVRMLTYSLGEATFGLIAAENHREYRSGGVNIKLGETDLMIALSQRSILGYPPFLWKHHLHSNLEPSQIMDLELLLTEPYQDNNDPEIDIHSIPRWMRALDKYPIVINKETGFKTKISFEMDENKSELDREGMVVLKLTTGKEVFYQAIDFKQSGYKKVK